MASKIIVNLDTSKENYIFAKCKQNDDLTLEAFIYENGEPLDLTNKEITIQALKADNTYIIQNTDITKSNNNFTANLVKDFSRVTGTTKIEIVLTESSKQNTTFSFCLEVVGSVIRGAVQSSDSVTALEKMQEAVIEIGRINQETQTLVNNAGAASKEEVNYINTLLPSKRDKSVVLGANDIEDLNLNNFNEETRAKILGLSDGETNINAVLGEKNVTEYNLGDGEVSSLKTYMFEGTVINNSITVDYILKTVTIKGSSYICANWRTYLLAQEDLTIPIPSTAYSRVHILLYDIDTRVVRIIPNNVLANKKEIVICYLYNNNVYGKNASKINCIVEKEKVLKNINDIIKEVLSNNSKSNVKVKFIGDSIAAGVKATGYGLTEIPIGNTGKFVPKQDSSCWANLLGRNIEKAYSKSKIIGCNDKKVRDLRTAEINKDKNSILRLSKHYLASVSGTALLNFEFYGEKVGIYFTKQNGSGIVGIYVDNNKIEEIDLYSVETINSFYFKKTGLTGEKHILTLKYEGKNESSLSSRIYVEGFKIEKRVNCINYGISGINTEFVYNNLSSLIETDDDIIIMQIGTNDRAYKNLDVTRNYLIEIINYIRDNNKQLILCCSLPASETNESNELYCGKMSDVMNVIIEVANIYNIKIINNYNYIKKYCLLNKIDINTLLADGLHPNDEGYYLMYSNCCEVLELPII